MTLFIDSTQRDRLVVELRDGLEVIARTDTEERAGQAQQILPMVDGLMRQAGLELDSLSAIEVNAGPGSFTGTRVGVAVANGLGLALGIPVNGQPIGEGVAPVYGSPPAITLAKAVGSSLEKPS